MNVSINSRKVGVSLTLALALLSSAGHLMAQTTADEVKGFVQPVTILAALLLSPRRQWAAYLAVMLPVEVWADWGSFRPAQILGFAAVNMFEVLLAADAATPERLEREGFGVQGSRFTYAVGRLVLWSASPGGVDPQGAVLRSPNLTRLALADPKLAPYGAAAVETLRRLGVIDTLRPRFVQGESIGQAHQFVASGNAQAGFVALSQVQVDGRITSGSAWVVPTDLHSPLQQDAVLLQRGRDNPAAQALMRYLRSPAARQIILAHGYSD
mgnify:CR=1 FL=1